MKADVRAVELRWFASEEGLTTLTPRVIGETEQTAAAKRGGSQGPMELTDWITERISPHGPTTLSGVQKFCALVDSAGGSVFIPSTRGSIVASWPTKDGKLTYPVGVYPSGIIVLRLGYLKNRPAFASEEPRRRIYDELVGLVGPLHTQSLSGEPGFRAELLNDPTLERAYSDFLAKVVERAVVS